MGFRRILLDTNILLRYYLKKRFYKHIKFLLDDYNKQRADKKLVFYLPNVCISETFCKLFQERYIDQRITEPEFKEARANFLNDLKRRRFKNWQLRDVDIKRADALYEVALKVFNKSEECYLLGDVDICILAMMLRLKETFKDNPCYLFTLDGGLQDACWHINTEAINLHDNRSIPSFLKIHV